MRRVIPVLFTGLLLVALAAPATSAGVNSTWHRFNPGTPGEHERLVCVGGDVWHCTYGKLPEVKLDLHWDTGRGVFVGTEADLGQVSCPVWAGNGDVCAHAQRIVVGATAYTGPKTRTLWQELIFTDGDGVAPMYQYLAGPDIGRGAVCPWYRTFEEAQADSECYF